MGAGKTAGAMDAGQILKPPLARGELHCIGATTLNEYREYVEKDSALERRFQSLLIEEPSPENAITILRGIKHKYELHHGVRIQDKALVAAVHLSHRYIPARHLPDKAIDLIDEAASKINMVVGSVPDEVDSLQRQITHLEVEQEALKGELKGKKKKDRKNKELSDRLEKIQSQLPRLKAEHEKLLKQWQADKELIASLKKIKSQIEQTRREIEKCERESNLEKAAQLKYGQLPQLEQERQNKSRELEKRQQQTQEREQKQTQEPQQTQEQTQQPIIREEVLPEDIAEVVSRWTQIPVQKILQKEAQKLLEMETHLKKRIVGQDHVLPNLCNAIRRNRAGLSDPHRPMGCFLFLGPTGVGKTETVKALAEFLFDDEKAIVRMDMSEYMEKHSVARLIGAPPGYVSYEQGGQLTEKIRRKPYSIVLFDEIEKAHPEIFPILLQCMDEGHLTDGQGQRVDFKNTLLIMTSNIGSGILADFHVNTHETHEAHEKTKKTTSPTLKTKEMESQIQELLKEHFAPEFLNRLDETFLFHSLTPKDMEKIIQIHLLKLQKQLRKKNISLEVTEKALQFLSKKSYDPSYGARPVKRVLQKQLLDKLSQKILEDSLKEGDRVQVNAHDLSLQFQFTGPT